MDRLDIHTENECMYCETHVTPAFARQFGDRHGQVHRCQECDTLPRVRKGSAAGRPVDEIDPQAQPGRKPSIKRPSGGV